MQTNVSTGRTHSAGMLTPSKKPASRADVLTAMDTMHEVVASMNAIFTLGKVRTDDELDDSWNLDRYTCAAVLPSLATALDNFWTQLLASPSRKVVNA